MSEQNTNGSGIIRPLGAWEFDDAIRRDPTVLVAFSADRCSHCRAMEPILSEFAAENPEVVVYRVDADSEIALAVRMEIRQIPTFVLFHDGKQVDRATGEMEKSQLTALATSRV